MFEYTCSECGKLHMKKCKSKNKFGLAFCSNECISKAQKTGGCLASRMKKPTPNVKKQQETMMKRYGVKGTFASKDLTQKARNTMMNKYGDSFPQKLNSTKEKMKQTNIELWGHECTIHSDKITFDRVELVKKAFDTKREKGLIFTSKPENVVKESLISIFGVDDVVVHPWLKRWLMDFYVKSINTYVQVDGEYWHGLDRPIEECNVTQRKKFNKDRDQDKWFASNENINNFKLFRITDKQINSLSSEQLCDYLKNKLLHFLSYDI